MLKLLIFLLLLTSLSKASDNSIKVKAYYTHGNVQIKALIQYPTMTYKIAKKKTGDEYNAQYISHIQADVLGQTIFDLYTSPYLAKYNRFKFTFPYKKSYKDIKITATDNKGKRIVEIQKIKTGSLKILPEVQPSTIEQIDYRKGKTQVWGILSIEDAIKVLYGSKKIIDEKPPKQICGYYNGYMTLPITTDKNIKSIAIFQDHRRYPTVAILNTAIEQTNQITLNVSTERDDTYYGGEGNITIILEDTNDYLHKIIQKYDVSGYHESCHANEVKNDF